MSGHGTRDAQGEAIGVGGRRRHLPVGKAEAFHEQPPDHDRIFGRQHAGETLSGLAADRIHDRGRRVTEHRSGVAEAEVGVFVAVDVAQHRTVRFLYQERKRHRPVEHPVHGHAAVEARDAMADLLPR